MCERAKKPSGFLALFFVKKLISTTVATGISPSNIVHEENKTTNVKIYVML
jgi:hypothetical protein